MADQIAAPVAAPAVNPTPAPVAAPSPAPAATTPPSDPFMAELESKFSAEDAKISPPKEVKAAEPTKEPVKPAAAPTPAAKTPEAPLQPQPANEGPKALRERKAQLEAEKEVLTKEKTELLDKVKQYEAKGKDTESLLSQIDEAKKQLEAIQAENRMLKQETSPEFKSKYDKPFEQAATYAQKLLHGLEKADGTTSTWEEFAGLYRMSETSLNRAISEARAMFGENSGVVIQQITELHKLNFQKQEALQQEKAQWQERSKADAGKEAESRARAEREQAAQKQHFMDTFQKVNKDLEETVEAYRVPPEDKELLEARNNFLKIYDSAPKSQEEFMAKNAHIRQRAASFPVMQIQMNRLKAENAKLQQELDGLKPKAPSGDNKRQGGTETGAPEKSWEQQARDAVLNAR